MYKPTATEHRPNEANAFDHFAIFSKGGICLKLVAASPTQIHLALDIPRTSSKGCGSGFT
jgi:hypothetical protein